MLMMFALRFIRMGGTAIPDLGEILKRTAADADDARSEVR